MSKPDPVQPQPGSGRKEDFEHPQLRKNDGIFITELRSHLSPAPAQFTAVVWGHPSPTPRPLLRARDTEKQGLRGVGHQAKGECQKQAADRLAQRSPLLSSA